MGDLDCGEGRSPPAVAGGPGAAIRSGLERAGAEAGTKRLGARGPLVAMRGRPAALGLLSAAPQCRGLLRPGFSPPGMVTTLEMQAGGRGRTWWPGTAIRRHTALAGVRPRRALGGTLMTGTAAVAGTVGVATAEPHTGVPAGRPARGSTTRSWPGCAPRDAEEAALRGAPLMGAPNTVTGGEHAVRPAWGLGTELGERVRA